MFPVYFLKHRLNRYFSRRFLFFILLIIFTLYGSVLLLGDLKMPRVMHLVDLETCPACYGVTVCPELYSKQVVLEPYSGWNVFNSKNIFHGATKTGKKLLLKKLAYKKEFESFDSTMCSVWGLDSNCKPMDLISSEVVLNAENKIVDIVDYNFTTINVQVKKGLIMCPHAYKIIDFLKPLLKNKLTKETDIINMWTMLSINAEPIILQIIPKSLGWPVPAFGGVCGRIEVVANEGESLSSLVLEPWHRRLKFALNILNAALDFTFKHSRYRFYLMDWSLDNIVANQNDEVTFVDLEDVIVIDKNVYPGGQFPHWYEKYSRENIGPEFSFSIQDICTHHLSDHNLWAACHILAADETPLLYPIPREVQLSRPDFQKTLSECVSGNSRFKTVTKLQQIIKEVLVDYNNFKDAVI